jgi:hypothetical protein
MEDYELINCLNQYEAQHVSDRDQSTLKSVNAHNINFDTFNVLAL